MILRPLFQWRPYRGEGILATIVKNASISNSILITNAIPAEGIPNCANKMV